MAEKVEIIIAGKDGLSPVAQKATRSLDKLDKAARSAGKRLDSMGRGIGSLGKMMTVGITAPVLAAVGVLGKMASDVVESENLFEVSMGNMAGAARQFSEQLRDQFGLNEFEVRRQTGVFNSMFSSMKLGEQASYQMATGLTMLTADLASFYNLAEDDALQKLQSGIMGEIEPLRRLGVDVSETTVQLWAMNNGLIKQGQEMSQAQKILARYGVIMEQTSKAQGDLARTADSPANAFRRMQNQLRGVAIEVGQMFLPTISKALLWINNEGLPRVRKTLERLKEAWSEMSDEAKQRVLLTAGLLVAGGPLMSGLGVAIRGVGLLATAFGLLPKSAKIAMITVGGIMTVFGDWLGDRLNFWSDKFGGIARALEEHIGESSMSRFLREQQVNFTRWAKQARGTFEQELGDLGGTFIDPLFGTLIDKLGEFGADKLRESMADLDRWIGFHAKSVSAASDDWATAAKTMGNTTDELLEQPDILKMVKDSWDDAGSGVEKAGKKAKDTAKELGLSTGELITALTALHPATALVAQQVRYWEGRISDVNLALQANQDQVRAAQAEYGRMSERLSGLNSQLSETQRRLQELSRPQLVGMGTLGEQVAAVETQLKRLQYAELTGLDLTAVVKMFPLLTEGSEDFLRTLPTTSDELQKMLETMRLTQSLKYDEQLKLLGEAAAGAREELTFEQAMQGIIDTKNQIGELTGAISAQEAAMRSQQAVIDGLKAQQEALNRALQEYQGQLQAAQANQQLVNQSLQMAYTWLMNDREKFVELGDEGVKQAGIMDVETSRLLRAITMAAQDTTGKSAIALQTMVAEYQQRMAQAMLAVQGPDGRGGLRGTIQGVQDDFAEARIKAQGLKAAIDTLQDKTITITTRYVTVGGAAPAGGGGGGGGAGSENPALYAEWVASGGSGSEAGFQQHISNLEAIGAYHEGGSFMVNGAPGRDRNLVAMRLDSGEQVDITPAGRRARGGVNLTFNVYATVADEPGLRRFARQIKSEIDAVVEGAW